MSYSIPTIKIQSPAKINLFLHIVGRRENGYHNLQSIFQLIDLYDDITFTPTQHDDIHIIGDYGITPQDNLIYKAGQLLKPHAQQFCGVDIHLDKQIPMGAGLGGGSSNAASTLIVLNQLWQCHLTQQQLADYALQLGADVPFFIYGQNAWVEGIGEYIQPIELAESVYILLKPDCFISTQQLFAQKSLTRDSKISIFSDYQNQPSQFGNNFQPIAQKLYPEVDEALQFLNQFGQAKLTGTGSCCFVEIDKNLVNVDDILKQAPCKAYVVQSLEQSPLKNFKLPI